MIVTCPTFALYTSFTKYANQALAAAESGDGDGNHAVNKRWEFLKKSESKFNHLCAPHRLRAFHLDCVQCYASSEN
ncbi:hypothetical protein F4604DRAFT_1809835, partial [Suillus subluteus]